MSQYRILREREKSRLFMKNTHNNSYFCFFCFFAVSAYAQYLLSLLTISHFYIHIPFCRQRCPYCKFALTPVFDEFKKRRYIEYLKREIREYFWSKIMGKTLEWSKQKTIYFGGWTPSVLSHDEIFEILECFGAPLQRSWHEVPEDFSQEPNPPCPPLQREFSEITMEMNPEDVTPEYIDGVLTLGINRISLGIQTLNEVSLKEIHRSNRDTIFRALESMNKANISLNIDFILGLPFVKPGETLAGIQELHTRFPYITHTSVYMLEDESYPKHWRENSITEDEMQSEFVGIMDYFESTWWHHYELSNFAKPGYESVHNQSYWDHSGTRGFGLSAASYEWGQRWSNSSSFNGYYGWKRDNEEKLTPKQIELEKMMFGLRRNGWQYNGNSKKLDRLITEWLLEVTQNRIKPTKTWIFVIDHILSELISDS